MTLKRSNERYFDVAQYDIERCDILYNDTIARYEIKTM